MTRFDRQVVLPEVGEGGQAKLGKASVLVVGAGGLGSPVILYLAGAGVGRVDVCDMDHVEITNIHRQILFTDEDVTRSKSSIAAHRARAVGAMSWSHSVRFQEATDVFAMTRHDILVDCTDRFQSHDAVITTGLRRGIPVVHGSILALVGRVLTFTKGSPCWRCLNPVKPEGDLGAPGTLGPVCGVIGSMMAFEVLRLLLGGEPSKTMTVYEAMQQRTYSLSISRNPTCTNCTPKNDD